MVDARSRLTHRSAAERWTHNHLLGSYRGKARGCSMHGRKDVLLLGGLLRLPGGSSGRGHGLGSGRCGRLPGRLRLRRWSCRRSLGLPGRLWRLGSCLYISHPTSCSLQLYPLTPGLAKTSTSSCRCINGVTAPCKLCNLNHPTNIQKVRWRNALRDVATRQQP